MKQANMRYDSPARTQRVQRLTYSPSRGAVVATALARKAGQRVRRSFKRFRSDRDSVGTDKGSRENPENQSPARSSPQGSSPGAFRDGASSVAD